MANDRVFQSAIEVLATQPANIRVAQSAIQLLTIPGAMTASCNNPPAGLVGRAYSTTFTQVGGIPAITWSLVSGAFPTGLTLAASTGVLGGTPSAAGAFSFTIQATDSTGAMSQVACSITIGAAPVLSCNSPPTGTVGIFYSQQFGLSGGTQPYSLSLLSGSFPPGLSIVGGTEFAEGSAYFVLTPFFGGGIGYTSRVYSPYQVLLFTAASQGIVNGIPTAPGTFTFTLLLTDALGNTAQTTCSITIQGAAGSPCQTGGPG